MLPYSGFSTTLPAAWAVTTSSSRTRVTRLALTSEAERVVKQIEGVEKVVNNIEILPLSPTTTGFGWRPIYRAMYGHSGLNRYALRAAPPIHIIVKNGDLSREGVVANVVGQ
jgi:hyperosmotically inducible protein